VYDEFEQTLVAWQKKYARHPRREIERLCLLALEREQLVATAYREQLIAARLEHMPIADDVRTLVKHALLWVWKDEEMHTIYIRGALLRVGRLFLRWMATVQQLAGALGGWAGSVRQHVRWREAPFARLCATVVSWFGVLAGKIPSAVRRSLRWQSFREFALFNVDAERTAAACWRRLVELGEQQSDLPPHLLDEFRRMWADEDRHRRIFAVLADAFDEQDRLAAGFSVEELARRIGEVGDAFLPRTRRALAGLSPLGSGGEVIVGSGAAGEKRAVLARTLERAGLRALVEEQARVLGRPPRVAIKPTFMLGYSTRDRSNLTDPELVEELARWLRAAGASDVAVVEGRNHYDWYFDRRSVAEVARYFALVSDQYRVVDLSDEQVEHAYERGMAQYSVGRAWKDADLRITFGKLRSHPVELVSLAVANIEGIGVRCDQFIFAERQAQRESAVMSLMDAFPPHFALLDAYDSAPDGILGVMGCGRPRVPHRIYAGRDAIAVDTVAARHLGLDDPLRSPMLRAAFAWFGDVRGSIVVIGDDTPIAGWRGPYHGDWSALLSFFAWPVYVHGSGRGALFVPEMDEAAFPPREREGRVLRLTRRALQRLLGLRLPRA
jgi:uncharacterized protein (DUF362 family)